MGASRGLRMVPTVWFGVEGIYIIYLLRRHGKGNPSGFVRGGGGRYETLRTFETHFSVFFANFSTNGV